MAQLLSIGAQLKSAEIVLEIRIYQKVLTGFKALLCKEFWVEFWRIQLIFKINLAHLARLLRNNELKPR